jgi:hypothetical protein
VLSLILIATEGGNDASQDDGRAMNWRLWTWMDYTGLLLVAVLVVSALLVFVELPGFLNFNIVGTRANLGPDWTCTYPGKGDPVCIKKQPSN